MKGAPLNTDVSTTAELNHHVFVKGTSLVSSISCKDKVQASSLVVPLPQLLSI